MSVDQINPDHYKFGEYEVWPIQVAWLENVTGGPGPDQVPVTIIPMWFQLTKYLFRFPLKGNPLTDLKKARWMLDKMIERYEEEE